MTSAAAPRAQFGLAGFMLALAAMVLVAIHLSSVSDQPAQAEVPTVSDDQQQIMDEDAPQPDASTSGVSAFGQLLMISGTVLAGLAAVAGGIGLFRNEPKNLSHLAIGIGVGSILLQYVFWLALIVAGMGLMVYIFNQIEGL